MEGLLGQLEKKAADWTDYIQAKIAWNTASQIPNLLKQLGNEFSDIGVGEQDMQRLLFDAQRGDAAAKAKLDRIQAARKGAFGSLGPVDKVWSVLDSGTSTQADIDYLKARAATDPASAERLRRIMSLRGQDTNLPAFDARDFGSAPTALPEGVKDDAKMQKYLAPKPAPVVAAAPAPAPAAPAAPAPQEKVNFTAPAAPAAAPSAPAAIPPHAKTPNQELQEAFRARGWNPQTKMPFNWDPRSSNEGDIPINASPEERQQLLGSLQQAQSAQAAYVPPAPKAVPAPAGEQAIADYERGVTQFHNAPYAATNQGEQAATAQRGAALEQQFAQRNQMLGKVNNQLDTSQMRSLQIQNPQAHQQRVAQIRQAGGFAPTTDTMKTRFEPSQYAQNALAGDATRGSTIPSQPSVVRPQRTPFNPAYGHLSTVPSPAAGIRRGPASKRF